MSILNVLISNLVNPGMLPGLALGILLGGVYALTSVLFNKHALKDPDRFYLIAAAGMLLRLMGCLMVVTVVLIWVPVDTLGFISGLFVTLVLGLVLDVYLMTRKVSSRVMR